MTTKQLQFYRVLWSQAKRLLVAGGMTSKEAEAESARGGAKAAEERQKANQ